MKSAVGLGFKSKRETRYEDKDDCQIPLLYAKRKDDRTFVKVVWKCGIFVVYMERVLK